jgi:hypothetical protein
MLEDRDDTIMESVARKAETRRRLEERNAQNEQFKAVGEFRHGNEIPEVELIDICTAIANLHTELGGDAGATGDNVMMLKRLEDRMEGLTVLLDKRKDGVVRERFAERVRKRRDHERAEKAAKKQKEQDEKMLRTLQLATMPMKGSTEGRSSPGRVSRRQ